MLSRYAFAALCVAVIAAQGFAFPHDDKKNELDNTIPETDDSEQPVSVDEVTSPPAPTTLTVGVSTEETTSSNAASSARDDAPSSTTATTTSTTTPRPTPGNSLSRLIDDIFQIPISVLKAVNTLLSNPFRSKIGSHEQ